ncbi:MAG: hypothetical protein Q8L69_13105 [Gallionellaceae bacterium]|nr:hypothetical protein [Gallionellaceae bacterium]
MHNRSKRMMFVLGGLVILFGALMFWSAREAPLPDNARKDGAMMRIDIGEGAADEGEIKESLFTVPDQFEPKVTKGAITLQMKFPDGAPYAGASLTQSGGRIKVVIEHRAKTEARSDSILRHTQPWGGQLLATPWLVESKDGLDIYHYKVSEKVTGTYFSFVAKDGSRVLAEDAGGWSQNYVISRKLSPHIEITYLLPKKLVRDSKSFVEDVTVADNVVLKLVQSFQPK